MQIVSKPPSCNYISAAAAELNKTTTQQYCQSNCIVKAPTTGRAGSLRAGNKTGRCPPPPPPANWAGCERTPCTSWQESRLQHSSLARRSLIIHALPYVVALLSTASTAVVVSPHNNTIISSFLNVRRARRAGADVPGGRPVERATAEQCLSTRRASVFRA